MKTLIAILALAFLTSCQADSKTSVDSKAPEAHSAQNAAGAVVLDRQAPLDPQTPYRATRCDPVTYDVDFSAVVMPPYKSKLLRVWLPLPQSDFGQEVNEGEITTFPMKVEPKIGTEKVFGNKFAYFEFKNADGAQVVRHKFKVKIYELHWNIKPAEIVAVKTWPASFNHYLKGETQAVVIDDRFSKLLNEIVPQRGNPMTDMSLVMDYVIKDFKYDHNDASLHASSVWALEKEHGHCSDYHGFCSAMGRLLDVPTRVTYGINPFPKNSPSHCKMEAYLQPYGWVSFDVSETQNLLGEIGKAPGLDDGARHKLMVAAKDRLTSGFRDNTWFKQTMGTDYDLEPMASQRAAVVRTIYAEADGVTIPDTDPASKNTHAFTWMTVQKFTPDRAVTYPFKDIKSLEPQAASLPTVPTVSN